MKKILFLIVLLLTTIFAYSQAKDICYVHTATSGNSTGTLTYLDHPALNNNPTAQFIISHNLSGDGSVTYNDRPTSVFYTALNQWGIYNDDQLPMVLGSTYNVYIPGTRADILSAVSTGGFYYFVVDDPITNNEPSLLPVTTHVWSGAYMDYNYGVYYAGTDKWGIYTEDQTTVIPTGETFFMLANPSVTGYNTNHSIIHTADGSNQIYGNGSTIDHPLLNNNPDATLVLTHLWGVGSDHTYATYYDPITDKWLVVSEDNPLTYSGEVFHIVYTLPAPSNDLCANATPLTVGASFGDYDITSNLLGSDGSYYGNVWFTTVVGATGNITIETDQASGSPMHDSWMSISTGNCGSLSFLASDDNGGNGNFAKVTLSGLTPGETLYITIEEDAQSTDPSGEFLISAYDTTLGIADAIIDGFSMYPNPVKNILNLSTANAIDEISLYNMLGQEVLQSTPSTNQVELDMSHLPVGAYIVKVQAGEQIGTYNLIKE